MDKLRSHHIAYNPLKFQRNTNKYNKTFHNTMQISRIQQNTAALQNNVLIHVKKERNKSNKKQ